MNREGSSVVCGSAAGTTVCEVYWEPGHHILCLKHHFQVDFPSVTHPLLE